MHKLLLVSAPTPVSHKSELRLRLQPKLRINLSKYLDFHLFLLEYHYFFTLTDACCTQIAMLRTLDILEWFRIRGSMPLTNGSGSWIRILIFSSLTVITHNIIFLRLKIKRVTNSRNQGFSYYFCMMIEGSGSIPLTNGSGSPKKCGSGSG